MKINFQPRRLAQTLMWRFFRWSDMRFRLRSGLEVPVADKNEMATFREIFIQQEYDDFLDMLPPARTVLMDANAQAAARACNLLECWQRIRGIWRASFAMTSAVGLQAALQRPVDQLAHALFLRDAR